jgi:hypothetical protein
MCLDPINGKLQISKWTVDKEGTKMRTGLNLLDGAHWGPQKGSNLQIACHGVSYAGNQV